MYSECGKQLVLADKELRDAAKGLDQNFLLQYGTDKTIKCIFTVPDGPWMNDCPKR